MGHRCAPRVHLLIADEDDPVETVGSNIDPHDPIPSLIDIPDPPTQISLNSFPGHVAPETLRLVGNIADNPILVLIDGGSTHNFIQEQLVAQLGLPCHTTTPLWVMVGNGQHLECHTTCEAITIDLQNQSFIVDFYVLPIARANAILGVQWLRSLGPVLTDYTNLRMQFFYDGRLVELQGDPEAHRSMLSSPQLWRLCRHQQNLCFHITVLPKEPEHKFPDNIHPAVHHLLHQFSALFQDPNTNRHKTMLSLQK